MSQTTTTYTLGDRQVARLGYGAMQGPVPAYLARQKMKPARYRCCAMPWLPV